MEEGDAGTPPPPPLPIDREAIIILISALEGLYIETRGSAPQNLVELKSAYVQNAAKTTKKEKTGDVALPGGISFDYQAKSPAKQIKNEDFHIES